MVGLNVPSNQRASVSGLSKVAPRTAWALIDGGDAVETGRAFRSAHLALSDQVGAS